MKRSREGFPTLFSPNPAILAFRLIFVEFEHWNTFHISLLVQSYVLLVLLEPGPGMCQATERHLSDCCTGYH
jgi:hypothetical protein